MGTHWESGGGTVGEVGGSQGNSISLGTRKYKCREGKVDGQMVRLRSRCLTSAW